MKSPTAQHITKDHIFTNVKNLSFIDNMAKFINIPMDFIFLSYIPQTGQDFILDFCVFTGFEKVGLMIDG